MKIDTKQESALVIGAETTQFGLNLEDPGIFVQMLLNLYSDPISSSVREYLSNAWDANKEVGSTQPIVVGLTKDKFFVQDYGAGISPDFMNSGYCTIGFSTKRDSDQMIGAYGFGRLTFLSYVRDTTKQYWVHTVYEGIAYEYLIFLDGNTIKQTLISETPTEEPSGTRVVVQLKKDYYEFNKWKKAIQQQCAYFEGTVIDIEGERKVVEVQKQGIVRKSNLYTDNSHLILGSVYYEIDWNHFTKWNLVSDLNLGIYIGLDEGIIPTPSRESIVLNDNSTKIIESKFKIILEQTWSTCEAELREIEQRSRIEKLYFTYDATLSVCHYNQYKKICSLLGKTPILIEPDSRINGSERSVWIILRDCFKGQGVYCDRWTPLKKEYLSFLGSSYVERTKNKIDLYYQLSGYFVDIDTKRKEAEQMKNELLEEWIDHHYTRFDESGFEQWKKSRKPEKRVDKGVTYYRAHINDPNQCTQDKGDIDISQYRYVFKATESTAKKYWTFLNQTFNSFIITKDYGMDLDNLEPSPLLKRMCSEALKTKVYNILGNRTNDKKIRGIIKELNPLLAQYMDEVPLKEGHCTEIHQALIEAGDKYGCFDKDEVKLRYMEHHLKLLEFAKYVGYKEYSWSDLKLGDNEAKLIKRHYILERLAEKKWKEEEQPIDTNQLELELN